MLLLYRVFTGFDFVKNRSGMNFKQYEFNECELGRISICKSHTNYESQITSNHKSRIVRY